MFIALMQLAASAAVGFFASHYLWENDFFAGEKAALTASFFYACLAYRVCLWMKTPPVYARTIGMIALGVSFYILPETYFNSKFYYVFGFFAAMFIVLPAFFSGKSKSNVSQSKDGAIHSFEGKHISLFIDYAAGTARLVVRKPDAVSRKGDVHPDKSRNKFDETFPLFQLRLEKYMIQKEQKEKYEPGITVITGSGPFATAKSTPGGMVTYLTGISTIEIGHRGAHKASTDSGGVQARDGGEGFFIVRMFAVPNAEADRFSHFIESIKGRVEQEHKKFCDEIIAENKALMNERRLATEKAEAGAKVEAAKRAEQLRQQAAAKIIVMLNKAGLKGDFQDAQHSDGEVDYLIAADRSGSGLIAVGDDVWAGSFVNAKATIVPGSHKDGTHMHLEVEVQDPAYENEYLKKRRVRVMYGAPPTKIQDWCDRVGILSSPKAPA